MKNAIDVIVLVLAVGFVVTVTTVSLIRKHRDKKNGCGGGCSGCPFAGSCQSRKEKK